MESWWLSWALADQSKAAGHQACSAWGSFFFWEPSVGNGESEQVTFPTFLVAESETAKGWPAGSKFEFPSLCPVELGQADCEDHFSRVEMLAFLVLCLLWASCTISWLFFSSTLLQVYVKIWAFPLAGLYVPLDLALVYFEALELPPGSWGLGRDKWLLVPQAGRKQACSVPTTRP